MLERAPSHVYWLTYADGAWTKSQSKRTHKFAQTCSEPERPTSDQRSRLSIHQPPPTRRRVVPKFQYRKVPVLLTSNTEIALLTKNPSSHGQTQRVWPPGHLVWPNQPPSTSTHSAAPPPVRVGITIFSHANDTKSSNLFRPPLFSIAFLRLGPSSPTWSLVPAGHNRLRDMQAGGTCSGGLMGRETFAPRGRPVRFFVERDMGREARKVHRYICATLPPQIVPRTPHALTAGGCLAWFRVLFTPSSPFSPSPRMATPTQPELAPRQHIQDIAGAASVRPHWGYADRVIPCVNDPGSCEYLDVVYAAHDVGMIYTGIIWATIGGILLIWAVLRRVFTPLSQQNPPRPLTDDRVESAQNTKPGFLTRLRLTLWSHTNRFLLPDCFRPIFGRTTRLQVLVLAILTGYLTIWSFAGMVYGIWITPVADHPGKYNVRSSLGPFADRVGVIAYALTPFSVLLASRESLLSVLTGIPYQNFNFLHRWLGYIIVVQSSLHTIGWSIIEIRLYQPQPQVAQNWIKQLYMIWGVVAMGVLLLLYVLSLPPVIRLTGYEFFRKSHYVLALVYIGACIGHWEQLHCFLTPAILLWFIDRGARAIRTFLMHYNFVDGTKRGFVAAHASITTFPDAQEGDVVRLDFEHPHEAWHIGQHFYLCFPESSIWQSHPFTPLNAPVTVNGRTRHSYLFRAKKGETKKMAELAARKSAAVVPSATDKPGTLSTPVILTGPYGDNIMRNVADHVNILCVAGGTGITYVLPVLLSLGANSDALARKVELVWVVRHAKDTEWVSQELETLSGKGISVTVLATRDAEPSSSDQERSSDAENQEKQVPVSVNKVTATSSGGHPDLGRLIKEFVDRTVTGRSIVFASGPPKMMTDARAATAACNSGAKVWKGEERFSVDFVHDERMER
ncbi:hypothetical protein ACRALDRAFT_1093843 [Sodiomyces alcalophilus JCM 7366]|uniref:uncharacterized protein n=1 Tax=Sodiomyces alcalophilus JCM 7366 TaxID=591952 RepID=UPI0039B44D16